MLSPARSTKIRSSSGWKANAVDDWLFTNFNVGFAALVATLRTIALDAFGAGFDAERAVGFVAFWAAFDTFETVFGALLVFVFAAFVVFDFVTLLVLADFFLAIALPRFGDLD